MSFTHCYGVISVFTRHTTKVKKQKQTRSQLSNINNISRNTKYFQKVQHKFSSQTLKPSQRKPLQNLKNVISKNDNSHIIVL